MAEAGLFARQDAELRANLDAFGAFAKQRSRTGMFAINPHLTNRCNENTKADWIFSGLGTGGLEIRFHGA